MRRFAITVGRPGATTEESRELPGSAGTQVVVRRREKPLSTTWALLIAFSIFSATFFFNSFRLGQAIDLKADEATYVIEGVSFYRTGMTMWNGGPFFVHPPIFFVVEGAYFKALGIGQSPLFDRLIGGPYTAGEALLPPDAPVTGDNMVNAIIAARYLVVFYGALVTVLVFAMGLALRNWQLGLLGTVIFMLDPYVLWRNHFNYLEPLATLFGVLMMFTYYRAITARSQRVKLQYLAAAGLTLGLSLLTKELALLYAVALTVHWLLFRRRSGQEVVIPIGLGMLMYSLFPAWAAANGELENWWNTKTWLYRRLTGEIQDTGIGRPGASLARTLSVNVPDYWPWFLILGIAAVLAAIFLYFYLRRGLRDTPAEFLTAFIIGTYGFFAVVRVAGGVINEHFFYFLMPVAVLAVAYGLLEWPRLRARLAAIPVKEQVRPPRDARPVWYALLALAGLLLLYNLTAWFGRYALGTDNSYAQVNSYLASSIPAGEGVVGRDLLDLYLLPKNDVYTFSYLNLIGRPIDPANVLERKIPYAILNEQSLLEGYGGANPAYYNWVQRNGEQVYEFDGRLYDTYIYEMDYNQPVEAFGTESIAVGQPAFASSTENPARYAPANAFDALITTRWASEEREGDNVWIYVDLGESKSFSRIELSWEEAFAKSYQVQVSDDAQNWTTFHQTNSGAGGLETIYRSATGRYVRLLMTERGTKYGYSLWEMSIYP